ISGGDGIDRVIPGAGSSTLEGGLGFDWISFLTSRHPVQIDLAAGTASGDGNDTLAGFEGVFGSNEGDVLRGDSSANPLVGERGNDHLFGRGGSDTLLGGIDFYVGDLPN